MLMYACERMYIFCFFEMAWDDLKGIILQRIERLLCNWSSVSVPFVATFGFSGYLCIASKPNGYSAFTSISPNV